MNVRLGAAAVDIEPKSDIDRLAFVKVLEKLNPCASIHAIEQNHRHSHAYYFCRPKRKRWLNVAMNFALIFVCIAIHVVDTYSGVLNAIEP